MAAVNFDPQTWEIVAVIEAFLVDRRSRGLTVNSVKGYQDDLRLFQSWAENHNITQVQDITPPILREYIVALGQTRNNGGVYHVYKTIRAMLNWFEMEYEPENWKNPIQKVKPPKVNIQPLPGITLENIQKLVDVCDGRNKLRDKTILFFLLDTGCRAAELLALNIGDINPITNAVTIHHGKGDKRRVTYYGKKTGKLLRSLLRTYAQTESDSPLFLTDEGDRVTFITVKQLVYRLADKAKIERPGLHDFRRAFALQCRRNGMDILTIARLLGHTTMPVPITARYIAYTDDDLAEAHHLCSPADRLKG